MKVKVNKILLMYAFLLFQLFSDNFLPGSGSRKCNVNDPSHFDLMRVASYFIAVISVNLSGRLTFVTTTTGQ